MKIYTFKYPRFKESLLKNRVSLVFNMIFYSHFYKTYKIENKQFLNKINSIDGFEEEKHIFENLNIYRVLLLLSDERVHIFDEIVSVLNGSYKFSRETINQLLKKNIIIQWKGAYSFNKKNNIIPKIIKFINIVRAI